MDAPRSLSVHVPVTLLSLALATFFASQIGAASRGQETINWQLENLEKQLVSIRDGQKQLTELITKREDLVKQSGAVQEQYTKLFNDVLDLAKADPDAAKVVEKYRIQRTQPTEGTAPAPDAQPKPAAP
jgi:hypothetical protein